MKERPILFSTPMVQAILEGRKTMTRRAMKIQPPQGSGYKFGTNCTGPRHKENGMHHWIGIKDDGYTVFDTDQPYFKCPYGKPGDVLWVREKFRKLINCETGEFSSWDYYADMPEKFHEMYPHKWKPSIHMPKSACRLRLLIKSIRVERLQDITEEDAKAEGLKILSKDGGTTYKYGIPDTDGLPGNDNTGWNWQEWEVNPINAFKKLWQSINGPESWEANPYVWCIEFSKI